MLLRFLVKHSVVFLAGGIVLILTAGTAHAGIGFQPVSSQELQMTEEPAAPGASAIILYREVYREDRGNGGHQDNYVRIKILTEAGRKYADVEIPFIKKWLDLSNVHARSIAPDGTITNVDAKPFEKTIVKARGFRFLAKVFSLPNVQKGSIIEYTYTYELHNGIYDSYWTLSDELFTKTARFALKSYSPAYGQIYLRWTWKGLPPGTTPPTQGKDHIIRLEVHDVPAFQVEDFMPPEEEVKSRVDFIYSFEPFEQDVNAYWGKVDRDRYEEMNAYLGKRGALQAALSQMVSPADDSETKLRKIYARVQQLRNTSFEEERTVQEDKRDKVKENKSVEDVWKRGYGDGPELTWLYLALVREAGFEAYGVWISERMNYFFDPSQMDAFRLDTNVVLVKLNGKDIYCDPGSAYAPFGVLPWSESGVKGLELDSKGGVFIKTPLPDSSHSQIVRKADLKLNREGDLEGKLTVIYSGLEALSRRTEEMHEDDKERTKYLESTVKDYISAGAEVELQNHPDWTSSSPELVAEFKIKVPGWAASTGKRMLLPAGIFTATEKGVFDHAERLYPVYFEFPFQKTDDITIDLPEDMTVSNLPAPQKQGNKVVTYMLQAENNKNHLHITRTLRVDVLIFPTNQYPALRSFFQLVRTGDDSQIMLQPQLAAASN